MALRVRRKKSKHKKKIRYSTKITILGIMSIAMILSILYLYKTTFTEEKEEREEVVYKYKDKYTQDYSMNLLQNNYISNNEVKNSNLYVSKLVKDIIVNYNYDYEGIEPEQINCTYNVKGKLIGKYALDGNETQIWEKEYTYLNDTEKVSTDGKLNINENVKINLNDYNKFLEKFILEQQISIASTLFITFEANITAYKDGQMIPYKYTNQLELLMKDKVIEVKGDKEGGEEHENTRKIFVNKPTSKIGKIIAILVIAFSGYVIIIINRKTKVVNSITNMFKVELNQILTSCDDRIVKVSSKIELDETRVVELKDINELVKLSEEIFKPILYYQFTDRQEAWFCLINENESYRFILK